MKVKYSRNIFIDSEINTIGNGQKTKVNLPPSSFSIGPHEDMRLIMTSFEMRRNWYSVNPSNNTFYSYAPATNTYTEITIAQGSYRLFGTDQTTADSLCQAVFNALTVAGITSTVTWSEVTRKFVLTVTAGMAAGDYFVCFQVKSGDNQPAGVSGSGYFNDVHEILGCRPTRSPPNVGAGLLPVNAFRSSVGLVAHTSPYVGALNSLEAVYIRTNLQTNNYQTYGFERSLPDQQGVTPTQIFARIPLTLAYYDDQKEFISFEDTNDLFTIILGNKQLDTVTFRITDDKGRDIQEISPGMAEDGMLSFKLVYRWEIIVDDTEHIKRPLLGGDSVLAPPFMTPDPNRLLRN